MFSKKTKEGFKDIERLNKKIDKANILNAKSLIADFDKVKNINEAEFSVFSQWGDDGIIQYLINNIPINQKTFVEFGVGNYLESNTRFLLVNNNWSGLVMDSLEKNIEEIKNDEIYWKFDLKAVCSFVTIDNINLLLEENGISSEIGLLHIDIDGNDYWIWDSINIINPQIVIMEYNSLFGKDRAITIPYTENFDRSKAHYSNLYAGSSLKALKLLGESKGYSFIGCNSAGNNAYFLKKEFAEKFETTLDEGFTISKFRESRDKKGNLNYLTREQSIKLLKGMDVVNVETNQIEKF